MTTPNEYQLVRAVLSRIVATADEHAALQNAFKGWSDGYNAGYEQATEEAKGQSQVDNNLLKMARAYVDGCPIDRDLSLLKDDPEKKHSIRDIACRMYRLGVKPEDLDAIKAELGAMNA